VYEEDKREDTSYQNAIFIVCDPDLAQILSKTENRIILIDAAGSIEAKEGLSVIDTFERCPFKLYTALYGLEKVRNHPVYQEMRWFGKRVLIAEDYEVNQILMESLLEIFGIHPDFAENGRIASEMVKQNQYDLVLMDINMPEMDGIEATRLIRQYNTDIPIVALTANALAGDKERFMSEGMNGYLTKPMVMDQLYRVLEEFLNKGQEGEEPRQPPKGAYKDLQEALGLSEPALKRLFDLFVSNIPATISNLETAMLENNFVQAASYAHTIKGSASSLFIKPLSELAAELENCIATSQTENAKLLLQRVKEEFQKFLENYEG